MNARIELEYLRDTKRAPIQYLMERLYTTKLSAFETPNIQLILSVCNLNCD